MDSNEFFVNVEKQQASTTDMTFEDRQKQLFAQLESAEMQVKKHTPSTATMDIVNTLDTTEQSYVSPRRPSSKTGHFRGQESIFRKPDDLPVPRANTTRNIRHERLNTIRKIPDYCKNPHKWKKYSLEDVSSDDISDRTNSQAAFAFLRELEKRKERKGASEGEMEDQVSEHKFNSRKPVFVPRKLLSDEKEEEKDKEMFVRSKMILPEYVVGQKSGKKKNRPVSNVLNISSGSNTSVESLGDGKSNLKASKSDQLKLSHLLDVDEDED